MNVFNNALHRLTSRKTSLPWSISSFSSSSSSGGRLAATDSFGYWKIFSASLGRARLKIVDNSIIFVRNSLLQLENVTAQRLRRAHGIVNLYSRIYEQERLFELIRNIAQRFRLKSQKLLLSGALLSQANYDWKKDEIKGSDLIDYLGEIDLCADLKQKTMTCDTCGLRHRIETEVESVSYCQCPTRPASVYGVQTEGVAWTPFIERKDILVWRMENPQHKGMYIYKMYGRFSDVSAEDFLSVQLDMSDFRRTWDSSTADCHVVEQMDDDGALVYYWETNWPSFFANRDYCCYRQHTVDNETGMMVVMSCSTDHSNCPTKKKNWRVQDYWSVMTIKPFSTPDKVGMEFSLTGFENPGVRLPEKIITWVAIRGMPEFMDNMRSACVKLRKQRGERKAESGTKEAAVRMEAGYSLGQKQSVYA